MYPMHPTMPTSPHASPSPSLRCPAPLASGRRRRALVRVGITAAVAVTALFGSPAATATAAPDDAINEDHGSDGDERAGLSAVTECVIVNGDGTFTAFFGYDNRTGGPATRPLGERNRLRGADGAAPTTFAAGRHVAVFSATSSGSRISWRLDDHDAVATPRSVPCSTNPSMPEAPVTLLLMLAPTLVTGWWIRRRQRLLPCATASRSS